MEINYFRWADLDRQTQERFLARAENDITAVEPEAARIIQQVRRQGDQALRELNTRFEGAPPDTPILVPQEHFQEAEETLDPQVLKALTYAVSNVRAFHKDQVTLGMHWKEIRPGVMAGERVSPLPSAGFYVPRGRGSFPSMLYMLAVPAALAGVPRTCAASPPGPDGRVDPACLAAARLCGVDRFYAMGGAQAWAALAYGTETVQPVVKALGPGSRYVAAAKRLLGDALDCGLPAGPSESVILADKTPDPRRVALDLMVEAEHGTDSAALLVTPWAPLAEAVRNHLKELIPSLPLPRRDYVRHVFSHYGGIFLVDSLEEGAALCNRYAPEHLQLQVADPFGTLNLIQHAGEILLGENVPFSAANYAAGANAVLPTGGRAKSWSGVSTRDFVKHSGLVYLTPQGLEDIKGPASVLAQYEGFPAHKRALTRE